MTFPNITLSLPEWIPEYIAGYKQPLTTDDERMRFVIGMSEMNVKEQTGGPFSAAIFDKTNGKLIAPGVNVVVNSSCSLAHAEMMAIGIAQKSMNTFDLGAGGMPECELYASTAPCAMCLGAIPWSGVRRLICAARDEDARNIGFDEGAKIANWVHELTIRGIEVRTDVERERARAVLQFYTKSGGKIYNSREGIL